MAQIHRVLDTVEEQNKAGSRGLCGLGGGAKGGHKGAASWLTQLR